MALIKTIETFRTFLPANISFKFAELEPLITDVQNEFIVRHIGQDQLDALQLLVDGAGATGDDLDLLNKVSNAVAKLTILKWIPFGNLAITSGGFQVNISDKTTVASQWRVDKLEDYCRTEGWNLLESLNEYLWSKPTGIFTDYDASDERIDMRSQIFLTAKDFSKYYFIRNNYELFYTLRNAMQEVEIQYISPILGEDFYEQIKDQILNDTVTSDNEIIITMIKRALAPLSIYEAIASLGIDLSYWGITNNETSDRENTKIIKTATDSRLSYAIRKAGTDGRKHLGALSAYLNNNASDIKYLLYYDNENLYNNPEDAPDASLGLDGVNDDDSSSFIMV